MQQLHKSNYGYYHYVKIDGLYISDVKSLWRVICENDVKGFQVLHTSDNKENPGKPILAKQTTENNSILYRLHMIFFVVVNMSKLYPTFLVTWNLLWLAWQMKTSKTNTEKNKTKSQASERWWSLQYQEMVLKKKSFDFEIHLNIF